MKPSIILICLIILSGCSSIQQTTDNHAPVILVQHPFPYIPISLSNPDQYLVADIFIREDGLVNEVIIRKGSGIKSWDSMAIANIRTWKYTPKRMNNYPVACWVHQKMSFKIADPILYSLSALLFTSHEIADSIYNHLIEGRKFEEVVNSVSPYPTPVKYIDIGEVDIYQYSEFIRNSLISLSVGEFTKPIKYDDHYIIFKRVQGY